MAVFSLARGAVGDSGANIGSSKKRSPVLRPAAETRNHGKRSDFVTKARTQNVRFAGRPESRDAPRPASSPRSRSRNPCAQGGGAKSSADDLGTGRGVVLSRAATTLRSIETRPTTGGFVRLLARRTGISTHFGKKSQKMNILLRRRSYGQTRARRLTREERARRRARDAF